MQFPAKPSLTIAIFLGLLLVPSLLPDPGHRWRLVSADAVTTLADLPVPAMALPRALPEAPRRMPVRVVGPAPAPAPFLLDPEGKLRPFYQALRETREPGSRRVVRVLHYGDSPVTADSITADARALLQAEFGDAGHGFVLMAKPWAWYGHRGVRVEGAGWTIEASSLNRARDGLHGLGGVSFRGEAGAYSRITLPDAQHHSLEVQYLRQPHGGRFAVESAGQVLGEFDTAAEAIETGYAVVALPTDAEEVRVRVVRGPVRLFGVTAERKGPGVVYNSLGVNGGQVQSALRYLNAAHWTAAMRHARPDLVVINYGSNESAYAEYVAKQYPGELRALLLRVREALPGTPVLVMSPMDRGERTAAGQIETVATLPRVVAIQQQVAAETGCAFFNTFAAMGGPGTMGKWYVAQPRLVSADFLHPLPGGARIVGTLLEESLVREYRRYGSTPMHAPSQRAAR